MEPALSSRLVDARTLLGPKLWRATEQASIRAESTGFDALDRMLPGGGWPTGAVSEILHARMGSGELSLALPLLARLTQKGSKPVALIAPPHTPHAPRLVASGICLESLFIVEPDCIRNALWSAELLLRAGGSILMWCGAVETASLRRLQLAAESLDGFALLIRPQLHAREGTASALRLRVWREQGIPKVEVLKCRGARPQSGHYSSKHGQSTILNSTSLGHPKIA